MKNISFLLLFILSLLVFGLSAIAFQSDKPSNSFTQAQLNDQSLLGINWVQQSGEYQALAYQAFNLAKFAYDQALDQQIENLSVVVDLDETILDNSPYQASLIGTNKSFEIDTWNQWIKVKQATAIPGAIEFINYVTSHQGKVFFVSDREVSSNNSKNNDLEKATIKTLLKLGVMDVTEEITLLKGEFSRMINGKADYSKKWRFDAIRTGQADGINHNIVIFVGDNLNDFSEIDKYNNNIRKKFVAEFKEYFGFFVGNNSQFKPAYIVLPNPVYGAWENGLYDASAFGKDSILKMTVEEKNLQRRQSLIRWNSL